MPLPRRHDAARTRHPYVSSARRSRPTTRLSLRLPSPCGWFQTAPQEIAECGRQMRRSGVVADQIARIWRLRNAKSASCKLLQNLARRTGRFPQLVAARWSAFALRATARHRAVARQNSPRAEADGSSHWTITSSVRGASAPRTSAARGPSALAAEEVAVPSCTSASTGVHPVPRRNCVPTRS